MAAAHERGENGEIRPDMHIERYADILLAGPPAAILAPIYETYYPRTDFTPGSTTTEPMEYGRQFSLASGDAVFVGRNVSLDPYGQRPSLAVNVAFDSPLMMYVITPDSQEYGPEAQPISVNNLFIYKCGDKYHAHAYSDAVFDEVKARLRGLDRGVRLGTPEPVSQDDLTVIQLAPFGRPMRSPHNDFAAACATLNAELEQHAVALIERIFTEVGTEVVSNFPELPPFER